MPWALDMSTLAKVLSSMGASKMTWPGPSGAANALMDPGRQAEVHRQRQG